MDDLDLCEDAKWGLFRYLAGHYELPVAVWRMLDQVFHVTKELQKFKEHLPMNFVNYIVWSCSEEALKYLYRQMQLFGDKPKDYWNIWWQISALHARNRKYEDALDQITEELYLASRGGRHSCCRMLEMDLFCGEYEKAAERLPQLEKSPWCWHCWCKDCTEAWECKGYLALVYGQEEEADKCFERADVCALRRNDDVRRERLRLRRRRSRT